MDYTSKQVAKGTTIALWSEMIDRVKAQGLFNSGFSSLIDFKVSLLKEMISDKVYLGMLMQNSCCPLCVYDRSGCTSCPLYAEGRMCTDGSGPYMHAIWSIVHQSDAEFISAAEQILALVRAW